MDKTKVKKVYHVLHRRYKSQGWWPLTDLRDERSCDILQRRSYHPNDYSFPQNRIQQYEICIGTLLTQNTSWPGAEKSLNNLKKNNMLECKKIHSVEIEELKAAIIPSGYFNQKALKVKAFTEYYIHLNGKTPEREALLNIWGIGEETADSILLYAFKKPVFVVDMYTQRIFSRLFNTKLGNYFQIQSFFHNTFNGMNVTQRLVVFNEYHSLIVEHGKRVCKKGPQCLECVLIDFCEFTKKKEC